MKYIIIISLSFMSFWANAQNHEKLNDWFSEAYTTYPNLPNGILEAISYNMTKLNHHIPDESTFSCTGMPQTYGIMGLYLDGKDNFNNTLVEVSKVSGFSFDELIESPRKNILGTAKWLSIKLKNNTSKKAENDVFLEIIKDAAGLPDKSISNEHVRDIFALQVVNDLQKGIIRDGTPIISANNKFSPSNYFSEERLKKLNVGYIDMSEIEDGSSSKNSSTDYGPALWDEACDHSSRNGTAITHITIHTTEGSYAGAISWFNNCSSNVSAHYVIRSSDGQITQMVREYRKAWHIGNGNPYSIGIEHEAFIGQSSYYTNQMYQSSADLVKDIANLSGYNIPTTSCYNGPSNSNTQTDPQSTSLRIKGHTHYPHSANSNLHTDPGMYWDWPYYYSLLNGTNPPQTPTGNCTGTTTTTTTGNITSQTVQTSVSIISAGTVSSSANVNFKSPDISLNNGFTIDSWGEFYAENVNCNSPLREDYSIPKSEFRLQKSNLEVYPNPVTSFANIHFNIEDDNPVSIFITDITGKEITRIAENERFQKGNNQLNFNAENYPAGVYFITMQSGDQYATNKLIINK